MSTNDQQEAFEKLLGSNLARVFDLVRFAETKNAALLTFASASILALNLLSSDRTLPAGFTPALLAALPVFASAAFVCVLSFQDRYQPARPGSGPAQEPAVLPRHRHPAAAGLRGGSPGALLAGAGQRAVWHKAEWIAR